MTRSQKNQNEIDSLTAELQANIDFGSDQRLLHSLYADLVAAYDERAMLNADYDERVKVAIA